MHKIDLDGFDLKILALLQGDGRLGNQELSERVGLSPSQCSRRRNRLEEKGLVRAYRAELNAEALGLHVTAFTHVTLSSHSADGARLFAQLIERLDNILEAHMLTGDSDYLLKIVVPNLKDLSSVVNDSLLSHKSVASVRSSVVLQTLKNDARLPLPRSSS